MVDVANNLAQKFNLATVMQRGDAPPGYQCSLSTAEEDPEWDDFVVNHTDPHHEQLSLWGKVQRGNGWSPLRLIFRQQGRIVGGAQILERPVGRFWKVGYLNRGPLLATDDRELIAELLEAIKRLAQKRRYLYLAVVLSYSGEAIYSVFRNHGFCVRPERLPPKTAMASTIVLDLSPDLDTILMGMRASTRQNVRKGLRRGLAVRQGGADDVAIFQRHLLALCRRRGVRCNVPEGDFLALMWEAFSRRQWLRLFLTEKGSEPVGAMLLLTLGSWARVWRVGWSGTHENCFPNELIHWETIAWARQNGYRYYDFVGFDTKFAKALESGTHLAEGEICKISKFKQGFGGQVMTLSSHLCYFPMSSIRLMASMLMKAANITCQPRTCQAC